MKASYYNFFYQNKSDIIAYNSRSGAIAILENQEYEDYKSYINGDQKELDEFLLKSMIKGDFIIDDDLDELSLIEYNMLKSRYFSGGLGLTIAPTLDCNCRCTYCYEKDNRGMELMSEEVQNRILDFIKCKISSIIKLNVAWYGGEPLLAFDIIKRLSDEIINLCAQKNVEYDASIITNGYLLNEEILDKLKDCKISFMQCTLDGAESIHNKRRYLVDKKPTYEKIISNLLIAKKYIDKIAIRVNIDNDNKDSINQLLDDLKRKGFENSDEFVIHLGKLEDINNAYKEGSCMKTKEFSEFALEFDAKLAEYNLKNKTYETITPKFVSSVCGADIDNSFVIDPKGYLYKCWDDIGAEDLAMGNLEMDTINFNEAHLKYLLYNPVNDNRCSKCKYLPLCMGGCHKKRLADSKSEDRCNFIKYQLEGYLKMKVSLAI